MSSITHKRCPKCGQTKEISAFNKNRHDRTGYECWCRECFNGDRRAKNAARREANIDSHVVNHNGKICPECGVRKPLSEFYKNIKRPHGVDPYCKSCESTKKKQDRIKNPSKYKCRYARRYANGGRERANRERDKNKDRINANARANHQNRKEKHSARMKKHYAENKEGYAVRRTRRRAREMSAEGHFTPSDIQELYDLQDGHCGYCGITLHDVYHIEHYIPLVNSGSNWPDNLVLSCAECNFSKHTALFEDWQKRRGW